MYMLFLKGIGKQFTYQSNKIVMTQQEYSSRFFIFATHPI